MPTMTRAGFVSLIERARADAGGRDVVTPLGLTLLSDQLTPVLAYRRLVAPDERTAPSFLLESVEGGERQGRHSLLGARPALEVIAHGEAVRIIDHRFRAPRTTKQEQRADPLTVLKEISSSLHFVRPAAEGHSIAAAALRGALPSCVLGGWFGFAAYDAVRWSEPDKLAPSAAPPDDRSLPHLHFGLYDRTIVFDHVTRLAHLLRLVRVAPGDDAEAAYDRARVDLEELAVQAQTHCKPLTSGFVGGRHASRSAHAPPERTALRSNTTRERHRAMVERAQEYIRAGDIFQVVLGQRFERTSEADPFDVYRALRAVNPSPYMVYMQGEGCILIASSPEILCRVRPLHDRPGSVVTSRPLAGTRPRGSTPEEDKALERELLADEKERAEHIMLVDLGRNDLGRVCEPGTIELRAVMEVERYSHVMHISSTVTGELRDGLDCWDALRATLPVGTISGAPKVRAMQIIDELEPVRRGPYGGGMGCVGLDGVMDIALALRTIVAPTALRSGSGWTYHLQAAGGIVLDSRADAEFEETVNKSAALARAIDLAETAFGE